MTVNGNLLISSGTTLDDGGFQITGNGSNSLTVASGASLSLGSAGSGTAFPTNYTSISLDPSSTVLYTSDAAQTISALNYGNLTSSGSGARSLSTSDTIGIAGTLTPGGNSYTTTGSTIDFNSTGAQNIPALSNYNNLIISGSGVSTLLASISVDGDLTVAGGTLDIGTFTADRSSAGGTLTIAASCTLRIGGTGTIPANYSTHLFDPASIIDFYGTTQTLPAGTYENLTVSSPGGTITLGANVSVNGDINVNNGTLNLSTFTANRSSSGGSLTVGASGTLRIGGTNSLPTNYTVYSFDPASTVEFFGTSHTIDAMQYGNLNVTSSGSLTFASGDTIGIAGTFTKGTGSYTITGSTVNFNGTGAQTIAAADYNNLIISGDRSANIITLESGTITASGSVDVTATSVASYSVTGSIFEYNGSSPQTVAAITYGTLTLSNTGLKSINATITANSDVNVGSGTGLTIGGSGVLNFFGDLQNDGSIINNGVINGL